MKPEVYFIPMSLDEGLDVILGKIKTLIEKSHVFDSLEEGKTSVIKLHFGEEGNTGFVKPEYVGAVVEKLQEKGVKALLSDSNTLYKGRRTKSEDHTKLAYEHGFTKDKTKADVFIPEDIPEEVAEVELNGEYVKAAKVAKIFRDCDYLVDVSHFKGHLMTGFGGALKNIGMGCASRAGKLEQHGGISPHVIGDKCIACGACVEVCPVDAISIKDSIADVDGKLCIGCASCLAACNYGAMDVQWAAGGNTIQQKMAEYAKAVIDGKKDRCIYINFAVKITEECDCLAKDDPRIVDDIGIFVSKDPLAVDKACYDEAVKRASKDIFKEAHPERNGMTQLKHGVKIGLGQAEYQLVRLEK